MSEAVKPFSVEELSGVILAKVIELARIHCPFDPETAAKLEAHRAQAAERFERANEDRPF